MYVCVIVLYSTSACVYIFFTDQDPQVYVCMYVCMYVFMYALV
jgi:hypothetical protein